MTPTNDFDNSVLEIHYSIRRAKSEARRIRQLVLSVVDSGAISQRELGRQIGVSNRTIANWVEQARTERSDSHRSDTTSDGTSNPT